MTEPLEAVTAAVRDPGKGLAEVMAAVLEGYGDRPALGERVEEASTTRLLPKFDTISYRELWARVRAVAGTWHHDPRHPLSAGDRICVIGFASTDYATLDLACIHSGVVSVPLQSSAPLSQLTPIIAETEPRALATSIERLDTAVEAVTGAVSIRHLIVFDYRPDIADQRAAFESARRRLAETGRTVAVDSLAALIERGAGLPPAPCSSPTRGTIRWPCSSTRPAVPGPPKGPCTPSGWSAPPGTASATGRRTGPRSASSTCRRATSRAATH